MKYGDCVMHRMPSWLLVERVLGFRLDCLSDTDPELWYAHEEVEESRKDGDHSDGACLVITNNLLGFLEIVQYSLIL